MRFPFWSVPALADMMRESFFLELLMVTFCQKILTCRFDRGGDGVAVVGLGQRFGLLCYLMLLWCMEEDDRSILTSGIWIVPHPCGWIVNGPEELKQAAKEYDSLIELNLDNFGVTCVADTNSIVRGIVGTSAHKAHGRAGNTG